MPKGSFHRMGKTRADDAAEELELALVRYLAQILGVRAEERLDTLLEILLLARLAHLAGHEDPHAYLAGHLDGPMGALVVGHPAEEQEERATLVAGPVSDRELTRLDAMVDDPSDRDLRGRTALGVGDGDDGDTIGDGPIEVGQFRVERAVDSGGHGQIGVALGVEGAHEGVIVHDVVTPDGFVGVEDMTDLGDDHADPPTFGLLEHPLSRYGAGRVAGGEEQHVVAGVLEAAGQLVHDDLDAAVEERRDGRPWRGDQCDPHTPIQSSRTDG